MRRRNRIKKISFKDLQRYHRDKMTGKERNTFEKELQKDPFTEEATEGYGFLSPHDAATDIEILNKNLYLRIRGKKRYIYYRIAASIAVLMVISSVFVIINRNKPEQILSDLSPISQPAEIIRSQPIKVPVIAEAEAESEEKTTPSRSKAAKPDDNLVKAAREEPVSAAVGEEVASVITRSKKADLLMISTEKDVVNERGAVPSAARSKMEISSEYQVRGKIISSEDNMPVPGASISIKGTKSIVVTDTGGNFRITLPDSDKRRLVANFIGMEPKEFEAKADSELEVRLDPELSSLDEVVVVGYGTQRSELRKEIKYTSYNSPQPVIGKPAFDKYIQENMHRPDTTTSGQRVVVVVSFLVHIDGSLDSIKVVRSPHKAFSDEAIRLIKSGPLWKAAEEEGRKIEDEVRVRIIFR
jgi:hypothetical protein